MKILLCVMPCYENPFSTCLCLCLSKTYRKCYAVCSVVLFCIFDHMQNWRWNSIFRLKKKLKSLYLYGLALYRKPTILSKIVFYGLSAQLAEQNLKEEKNVGLIHPRPRPNNRIYVIKIYARETKHKPIDGVVALFSRDGEEVAGLIPSGHAFCLELFPHISGRWLVGVSWQFGSMSHVSVGS